MSQQISLRSEKKHCVFLLARNPCACHQKQTQINEKMKLNHERMKEKEEDRMETIKFQAEDGSAGEEIYVIAQTMLGGVQYLLVADGPGQEANAWILKDVSDPEAQEAQYETIEDDAEFDAVAGIFKSLLDEDADVVTTNE